jgi:membrane fusion protein, multidrug efflux system
MNLPEWRHARILVPLILAVLGGCGEAQDSPVPPPRPVLTTVVAGSGVERLALAGTVEPRYRTDLSFRVLGRIVARDVEVGDVVHKGQRVAALDPTALELTVRSQRAALANAQASLANATGVEYRQRTLRGHDVTAQATLESAEQALIAAEAEVTRARSNLTKSEEQLSYAELRSDFDGVVTAVSAEVGQVVSVGQTVLTVARPDVREAVVDIPESAVHDVAEGTTFNVALQLDQRIRTTGVLRELAPEADSVTRSRRARITLKDPPDTFRLGTTVTVRIKPAANATKSVRLPASAVLEREGNAIVFVINEDRGTVSEQAVTILARHDGLVTLASTLKVGTRVVTAGVNSLNAGQRVRFESEAER